MIIKKKKEEEKEDETDKEEKIKDNNEVLTLREFYENSTQVEEIDARACNIIIHGIKENQETGRDSNVMKELFKAVGVPHSPHSTIRLGAKKHDEPRPIKLIMRSKNEKEEFMSNLGKLKYAKDELKKISVTADYTREEREEIRRWVKKAKERNTEESSNAWKVRGSPRSGMRLIRIAIQHE